MSWWEREEDEEDGGQGRGQMVRAGHVRLPSQTPDLRLCDSHKPLVVVSFL